MRFLYWDDYPDETKKPMLTIPLNSKKGKKLKTRVEHIYQQFNKLSQIEKDRFLNLIKQHFIE